MSFSRKLSLSHILAAGVVGASLIGAPGAASAAPAATPESALARAQVGAMPGEGYSQYRRRGGYYGGGRGRGRGIGAGGIAAGVIGGLAAGALLGGALSGAQAAPAYGYAPGQPVGNVYGADPEFVNYCASRYRSFDPASGTFLGNDGRRYPCQ